jgi:CDP-diacylglycerol--inositol 3-phosphatidyltransferase
MHSYKDATPIIYVPILGDLTPAQLIAALTLPVCVYKNFVNLVQLWKGSKILVGVDLTERAELRAEEEYRKQHQK